MEFQVGDWTAVRSTNELVRGETRVRLEGRAMEVLQLLFEGDGAVVSKDDLIDTVWKLQVVSDHSITVVISDLRKALGDNPRDPRYIETIPKKGYRLVTSQRASISSTGASNAAIKTFRNNKVWWVSFAAITLMVGAWFLIEPQDITSATSARLIVLDAVNSTNDPSVDALASSITELTLDSMSRARTIELVRWRGIPNAAHIGQGGLAGWVLETRIIDAEDSRLLAMTLRQQGSDAIKWTTTQAVSPRHFRRSQDKALRDLSAELGLGDLPGLQPVFSAAAEELFWRARYLWSLRQQPAAMQAQSLLADVLEMAPEYFRAHTALADLYSHKTGGFFDGVVDNPIGLARFHVEQAAKIDATAIDVLLARGHIALFVDGDPKRALAFLTDVVDRAPNSATVWVSYANALAASGQFGASVEAINEAQRADPMDPSVILDKVWILLLARQFEEALTAAEAAERLGLSMSLYCGLIFGAVGDHSLAVEGWLGFLGETVPASMTAQISEAVSAANYSHAYDIIGRAIIEHKTTVSPVIPAMAFGLAENYSQTRMILGGLTGYGKNWLDLWAQHVPVISRAYKKEDFKAGQ